MPWPLRVWANYCRVPGRLHIPARHDAGHGENNRGVFEVGNLTMRRNEVGIYHRDTHAIAPEPKSPSLPGLTYGVPEKYRGIFDDGQKVKFSSFVRPTGPMARNIIKYE